MKAGSVLGREITEVELGGLGFDKKNADRSIGVSQ